MWLLALCFGGAPYAPVPVRVSLPAGAHRDLGLALGQATKEQAQRRFQSWANWTELAAKPLATPAGKARYDAFLAVHAQRFPQYLEELQGLADGAGLAFEQVFLASVWLEWTSMLPEPKAGEDHCSTYDLCEPGGPCLLAHNEDNAGNNRNTTVLLDVTLGALRLQGVAYAGEFPTSGIFLTGNGLGVTQNWVGCPPGPPGLARNWVGRALAEASGPNLVDDALRILGQANQTMGHNYNLVDFCAATITNAEVAGPLYSVRRIAEPFFHANQYQTLAVPNQTIHPSSPPRLARVAQLPKPTDRASLLAVMGDQENKQWPVFHDARSHAHGDLSDYSLATVVFDARARTAELLSGNPRDDAVYHRFDLSTLACRDAAKFV